MGTSSANPFKLSSYSGDVLDLVAALEPRATAVEEAFTALRRSGSPHVPALGSGDAALVDLVGDWRHLADFAGDVASAFFMADPALGDRPLTGAQRDAFVRTLDDDSIVRLGRVGYADRDIAVAEADRLAADVQALADGRISPEQVQDVADRAARGQHDPAFSVRFVEAMGVDGIVQIPSMIEAAWPDGDRGRNPGWGEERLAPFATMLGTAMSTRAATPALDRRDPDDEHLADADRLSERWVEEFSSFWQPDELRGPHNFHHSLLVRHADLPSDVLVDVAHRQLDWMLAHDATPQPHRHGLPWGPSDSTTEVNVLAALGADDDASLAWLSATNPGDGSLGYPGRSADNMTLLLGFRPYGEDPLLGDALARVVDNGLQHRDASRTDPLFETVIDTVAEQGEIHVRQLVPVLGDAARTHIDQLALRTDEVLPTVAGEAGTDALRPLHAAHDFLEVIMADDDAAATVYQGTLDYVDSRLAADAGDGLGGETRAIGGLVGLVTEADENAAVEVTQARIAARQSLVRGMGFVKDVAGLVPVAGNVAHAASLARLGLSGEYRTIDWLTDELDHDYAHMESVRAGVRAELSSAVAAYEYGVNGRWTADEVRAATAAALTARGLPSSGVDVDFFADGTTDDRRPIKPYGEMSEAERRAYTAWLGSDQVGDAIAVDRTVAGQRMDEVIDSLEHR